MDGRVRDRQIEHIDISGCRRGFDRGNGIAKEEQKGRERTEISTDRDIDISKGEPKYRNIEKSIYRKGEKSREQTINNKQHYKTILC